MTATTKVERSHRGANQFLELSQYTLKAGSQTGKVIPPLEAIDNLGMNRREVLLNMVALNYLVSVLIGALVDAERR